MIVLIFTRILLAALFLFAGTVHLYKTRLFLPIMPPFIPFPRLCVVVSGIFEILGGLGLLLPVRAIEVATGWGLVLLLLAVFPANIYMAAADVRINGFPAHAWMSWARLPLQPLLIVALLWVTHLWPFSPAK